MFAVFALALIRATASVGYCFRRENETIEAMIEDGDRAKYSAKSAGRNRALKFDSESEAPALSLIGA